MNKLAGVLILTLSGWLVAGCVTDGASSQASSTPNVKLDQALSEAEAAYQKAYSVEFAWRDTQDLLKAAKEAATKGEHDKALELARQVKLEGDMAYAQYLAAKKAGPRY